MLEVVRQENAAALGRVEDMAAGHRGAVGEGVMVEAAVGSASTAGSSLVLGREEAWAALVMDGKGAKETVEPQAQRTMVSSRVAETARAVWVREVVVGMVLAATAREEVAAKAWQEGQVVAPGSDRQTELDAASRQQTPRLKPVCRSRLRSRLQ